jgi:hypothetical protein
MPSRDGSGRGTGRPVRAATGRRVATPGESDLVADLVQALDVALVRLEPYAQTDARSIVPLLRASRERVEALAGMIDSARRHADLAVWRHDLRMHAAAIAGWSAILGQRYEEATRLRAGEALERNAKALASLLAHPAPPSRPAPPRSRVPASPTPAASGAMRRGRPVSVAGPRWPGRA